MTLGATNSLPQVLKHRVTPEHAAETRKTLSRLAKAVEGARS